MSGRGLCHGQQLPLVAAERQATRPCGVSKVKYPIQLRALLLAGMGWRATGIPGQFSSRPVAPRRTGSPTTCAPMPTTPRSARLAGCAEREPARGHGAAVARQHSTALRPLSLARRAAAGRLRATPGKLLACGALRPAEQLHREPRRKAGANPSARAARPTSRRSRGPGQAESLRR